MAEQGNNTAMRKALQQASYFLRRHHTGAVYASDGETLIFCEDVAKVVDAALAAPARNCDTGTAYEQEERFNHYCGQHYTACNVDAECFRCPLSSEKTSCEFAWAQMPYEERGDHA